MRFASFVDARHATSIRRMQTSKAPRSRLTAPLSSASPRALDGFSERDHPVQGWSRFSFCRPPWIDADPVVLRTRPSDHRVAASDLPGKWRLQRLTTLSYTGITR